MTDTERRIIEIVSGCLELEGADRVIAAETRLVEDLHVESVQMIEILYIIASDFRVELDANRIGGLRTIEDMCRYVEERSPRADSA